MASIAVSTSTAVDEMVKLIDSLQQSVLGQKQIYRRANNTRYNTQVTEESNEYNKTKLPYIL